MLLKILLAGAMYLGIILTLIILGIVLQKIIKRLQGKSSFRKPKGFDPNER